MDDPFTLRPSLTRQPMLSQGVLDDTRALTGLPAARLSVIRNPVVTPRLATLAAEAPPHPWTEASEPPLILAAGRLTEQKDFPTLLRAFATVRAARPARLAILGEGRGRAALTALAQELGIQARRHEAGEEVAADLQSLRIRLIDLTTRN